jgi:hypothetical protein
MNQSVKTRLIKTLKVLLGLDDLELMKCAIESLIDELEGDKIKKKDSDEIS